MWNIVWITMERKPLKRSKKNYYQRKFALIHSNKILPYQQEKDVVSMPAGGYFLNPNTLNDAFGYLLKSNDGVCISQSLSPKTRCGLQ